MKAALIILAAGCSSRMGSPKQILYMADGRFLLQNAIEAGRASRCSPIVLVLGAQFELLHGYFAGGDLLIVQNKDWQAGIASSIKSGLNFLQAKYPETEAVIISVADQPYLNAAVLEKIGAAYESSCRLGEPKIVASSYEGIIGVPALFPRLHFELLYGLEGDRGAGSLLRKNREQLLLVEFAGGAFDIDCPDDWQSFLNASAKEL